VSESLVIIPTFNEKDNIEPIIRAVMSLTHPFHILVVDDNSADGTATIVKNILSEFSGRLFIEERSGKLGLGTAYIHGFKWGLARGYGYIYEMDADFSHNPDDLPKLFEACATGGADLAIGSRSYYASAYVRLITGMPIRDATAGFKCYRRIVLESMDLDSIRFMGYAFQIEMKFTAWKLGFKIVEVPIIFTDRQEGISKMSTGIFKEAFFGVIEMKLKSLFKKYERRKS
jgi:dolichol-phosphate mannosyltransferase